jgi:hypothetical protein
MIRLLKPFFFCFRLTRLATMSKSDVLQSDEVALTLRIGVAVVAFRADDSNCI